MRLLVAVAVVLLGFLPSAASAALTPEGPATLLSRWSGPVTLEGRPPEVLVGAKVVVGEGGKPGAIQIRAVNDGVNAAGGRVWLPAEPGTYTFKAPHIRWDYRTGQLGIDQVTGSHALIERQPATSVSNTRLFAGWSVLIFTPPGGEGKPSRVIDGARLTVYDVFEPDLDQDFLGDKTEDRTDLRIRAAAALTANGRLQIKVEVANAGPLRADLPLLTTTLTGVQWGNTTAANNSQSHRLRPLEPGATASLSLLADSRLPGTITISAEGPDLNPADNVARIGLTAAPPITAARPALSLSG